MEKSQKVAKNILKTTNAWLHLLIETNEPIVDVLSETSAGLVGTSSEVNSGRNTEISAVFCTILQFCEGKRDLSRKMTCEIDRARRGLFGASSEVNRDGKYSNRELRYSTSMANDISIPI
jgi:hypothetical protein